MLRIRLSLLISLMVLLQRLKDFGLDWLHSKYMVPGHLISSNTFNSYEKAAGTPTGQKVVNFYTQTSRQVVDIHTEARRLADLKKKETITPETVEGTDKTKCECGSSSAACPCEPGHCACSGCGKSDVKKVADGKTKCQCGGDTKQCGCAPGQCSCDSCPKAEAKPVAGTNKTTCNCGGDDKNCPCEQGKCACSGCCK